MENGEKGLVSTWRDRVIQELSDLSDRYGKLAYYMNSSESEVLDDEMTQLLIRQLRVMHEYRSILIKRVNTFI